MATANIAFMEVDPDGAAGGTQPALRAPALAAQTIVNPTTSQQSAAAPNDCYVQIVSDAAVYISVGSNPTAAAAAADNILVTSYAVYSIGRGDKVAVINAA